MKFLAILLAVLFCVPPGADAQISPDQQRQLEAFAKERGSVRAHLELARIHSGQGRLDRALEELRSALEIAPNSEDVLATYARLALASRTPVAAILSLEALVRMYPTVDEYPYLLGVARMQAGEIPGAVEALELATTLAPRRALPHIALGLAENKQKRFEEARRVLRRGLDLDPENLEALAALAEAEEGLDLLDSAERHAQRVLERSPEHPTAHLVLGMVHMKEGRFEEARTALERSLAADPDTAKTHYQLSLACTRLGDREASRRHLKNYRAARQAVIDRLRALHGATDGEIEP